jgi:hypothetical protein
MGGVWHGCGNGHTGKANFPGKYVILIDTKGQFL